MYAFSETINMAGVEWTSPAHKTVAENLLIGNARIYTLDDLTHYATMINEIPVDKILTLTLFDAVEMGIPWN